jgi:hypothetical protein
LEITNSTHGQLASEKSVLQALYKVGNDSTVFQDNLNQCLSQLKENTKSYVPVIKNEKDYADFYSLTALNKSAIAAENAKHEESTEEEALVKIQRKLKKGLNADGGIYLPKIPTFVTSCPGILQQL